MNKKSFLLFLAVCLSILSLGTATSPAAAASQANSPVLGKEIVINAVDNVKHLPAVAYNSKRNEYLVVWHTEWTIGTRDIRAQRVSASGKLLGSEFTVFEDDTHDSFQPSVAYDPVHDRYLVTFIFDTFGDGSDMDLWGRLIPYNGPSASLAAFSIISWGTSQWYPKVVYAGGIQQEFFVVWNNTYASGTPKAYVSGKRISPDGSFPSGKNIADLTLSDPAVNYVDPDVSYNLARNEYLVVWDEWTSSHDIWGVRITGNAVPLGGGPFVIAGWPDNEIHPAVAACNMVDQYLVTWQSDVGTGGTDYAIYGYFITGAGALEHVFQIDNTTLPETEARVACNKSGNQYLVAYQQKWASPNYYGITARLIFPDHSMEDAIVVIPPDERANRMFPAVAGGGSNYLVVWEHERGDTSYQDIHGKLVIPYAVYIPFTRR